MSLPVIQYPLDPTGASPDNLITNEPHTLVQRQYRAVGPNYGAFFSASLVVIDAATQQPLTTDQYYAAELYQQPTLEYGQEICSIIMITDPVVSNNVLITYQALGGNYSTSVQAVIDQINNLDIDDRPVEWGSIIAKPDAYPPSHHLHDAGDLYGFEYVTQALDQIRMAILIGDDGAHDAIYQYIDLQNNAQDTTINANTAAITSHVNNLNNPHQTTPAQIGAATPAQVATAVSTAQTALQTQITSVDNTLIAHTGNTSNPHATTAAQVGAMTTAQTNAAIAAAIAAIPSTPNPYKVGDQKMWHGAVANIASVHGAGWQLADGTNGTADCRNRFIVGAGATYAVGATGGATTVALAIANLPSHNHPMNDSGHAHGVSQSPHAHGVSDPGHNHDYELLQNLAPQSGSNTQCWTGITTGVTGLSATGIGIQGANANLSINAAGTGVSTQAVGSGTAFSILPPYYALCILEYTG